MMENHTSVIGESLRWAYFEGNIWRKLVVI